jgi:hypothetical protein
MLTRGRRNRPTKGVMSTYASLFERLTELQKARFNDFEQELLRRRDLGEREATLQKQRERRRREFVSSIGIDAGKFDAASQQDQASEEAGRARFLDEFRPEFVDRRPVGAADAQEAAIRAAVLAEAGCMVLPAFASSIMTPDKGLFADVDESQWNTGALNSGWVFADDPSKIRIKDRRGYHDMHPAPEFGAHFGFVPARTALYEMTAVMAFHGFYILRSDDSWWNSMEAGVTLTVQVNVHQYSDAGWHDFAVLHVKEDNADAITSYDRTLFFDYTTGLRAGDPVVVTVKGTVDTVAFGRGTYAELNFADGTANYIQPLLLSVQSF